MRDITRGLNAIAPDGAPVAEILARLAAETRKKGLVDCELIDETDHPLEDPETCTQIYWIAQEALNNAVRHGEARRVTIHLAPLGRKMSLTIRDDGKGLTRNVSNSDGVGLQIMHFRAAAMGGNITIANEKGAGVCVRCVFPVHRMIPVSV